MTDRSKGDLAIVLGLCLTTVGGCGGALAGMAGRRGDGGTVRVQNATQSTPICEVETGYPRHHAYRERIEPGAFADFKAELPGNDMQAQQPVKLLLCGRGRVVVQNVDFAQGPRHFLVLHDGSDPPAIETPAGFARYDQHNVEDASELANLPKWQDQNGVKPDWVFFSLRSRCDHAVDYKYSPGTIAPQPINPAPPGGHKSWKDDLDYKEIATSSKEPVTVWLRDRKKGGSGDWIEGIKIEPGKAARLEIDRSCKRVVERTDNERYHGCYRWAYAAACGLDRESESSSQPAGCAEGTPSVEGDMSRTCQFPTAKGQCVIRFAQKAARCDSR